MEDSSNWFMSIWNLESDDLDCTNLESDDLDEHMEGSNGTGEESDDLDEHLEDTKGIEEETLYDCALFNGKPYRELTTEDLHGVAFKTIEDVESFYSYYSLAMGFSVRKFKLDWNASRTVIIRRSLVCSKQGARKESGKARLVNEVEELRGSLNAGNQHKNSVVKDCQPTQKRKKQRIPQSGRQKARTKIRRVTRGNCPAALTVNWCSQIRAYYASQFITEHNHSLARMEHLQFLNSHRHVLLKRIKSLLYMFC
ncbi:hypothetical protein ACLB2K_031940 [Fragaria x ananassa]